MRSDPTIQVTCDWCLKQANGYMSAANIQVGMTGITKGGYDERNLEAAIVRERWTVQDGEDICEDCWSTREDGV